MDTVRTVTEVWETLCGLPWLNGQDVYVLRLVAEFAEPLFRMTSRKRSREHPLLDNPGKTQYQSRTHALLFEEVDLEEVDLDESSLEESDHESVYQFSLYEIASTRTTPLFSMRWLARGRSLRFLTNRHVVWQNDYTSFGVYDLATGTRSECSVPWMKYGCLGAGWHRDIILLYDLYDDSLAAFRLPTFELLWSKKRSSGSAYVYAGLVINFTKKGDDDSAHHRYWDVFDLTTGQRLWNADLPAIMMQTDIHFKEVLEDRSDSSSKVFSIWYETGVGQRDKETERQRINRVSRWPAPDEHERWCRYVAHND